MMRDPRRRVVCCREAGRDGSSLNAALACKADDRRKLERLRRDVASPAIALERLSGDGDGLVALAWSLWGEHDTAWILPTLDAFESAIDDLQTFLSRMGE